MQKRGGERGEYKKRLQNFCVWCGEPYETNHGNARTCGQKCRSRLAAFRARTGFDPEDAVGDVTAEAAFDELVKKLVAEERERRARIDALKTGGAQAMFDLVKQQEQAKTKHRG